MSNQINEGAARYQAEIAGQNPPERSDSQAPAAGKEQRPPQQLVTEHLDLWTSTVTPKSTAGRGRGSGKSSKLELTGIKKLRELILELAVRGKLVPQNPDDEPAAELLQRIETEKAQLVKDGKLKKQKPLPPVNDDEKPFELPEGWEWVRLGNLGNTQTGGTPAKGKAEYFTGNIPFVKPGDIDQGILKNSSEFLSESGLNALGREVPKGSLLMVCIGTIGKCAISRERCSFNQQINSITPFLPMEEYLLAALSSSYFQEMAWSNSSSTTISILNKGKWGNICIPLPPLAEQQRIVAKVDELMALCDQLEQQSEHQLTAHQQLTDTLLATLTESANAQELSDNWQRLAQHFDLLFSGPMGAWAIDRLKDTILQLAVMGKLVQQNPEDEPASELLKRIDAEKARLVKEGKIKKPKKLPPVSDEEKPFGLPEGWEWVRFGTLSLEHHVGIDKGKNSQSPDLKYPYFKMNNILNTGGFDIAEITNVDATEEEALKFHLSSGDFLFNTRNSKELVGKTCVFENKKNIKILYNNNILRAKFSKPATSYFIDIWMRSISGKYELDKIKSGTTNVWAIYQGKLENLLCPFPSEIEQTNVIAKVGELFALCDQLKDRLQQASETQLNLTDAIIEQALN
ncbi:restriction endonuclease subunit S [Bacterioplanoides pacificum]|uniref:Restriction endonuclease subunit S n=1 Tax=Bacterioplanoides pacificum TaxID=1171596 RepID=A0ABV7VNH5_9GAMM